MVAAKGEDVKVAKVKGVAVEVHVNPGVGEEGTIGRQQAVKVVEHVEGELKR